MGWVAAMWNVVFDGFAAELTDQRPNLDVLARLVARLVGLQHNRVVALDGKPGGRRLVDGSGVDSSADLDIAGLFWRLDLGAENAFLVGFAGGDLAAVVADLDDDAAPWVRCSGLDVYRRNAHREDRPRRRPLVDLQDRPNVVVAIVERHHRGRISNPGEESEGKYQTGSDQPPTVLHLILQTEVLTRID